ncbi:methylenetetrahydrofolate reduct [Atractiella rhizophila]|nr:methylenetetrahydrofolate reduct [Atractiella rhizophila]
MVKISQKLRESEKSGRLAWSFEYFPPKTLQGVSNLYDRIERMSSLGPSFIDITWGAGGTTSDLTTQFVKAAHSEFGLETCMHLTCTNMPVEMIDKALEEAYEFGCHNILALRGDPPRGQSEWTATEGGFSHAIDLVRHIRKKYGDHFDIAVAGFPQGHDSGLEREQELKFLKEKIDAGANFIFTQMFYDADLFIDWVRALRAAGISVPIIPGIMPIQTYASFERRTKFANTLIPRYILDQLEPIKEDDAKVRDVGTKIVADMCRKILNAGLGINFLHVYTMNLEKATKMLLQELNCVPHVDVVKTLPWRPSLTSKRRLETTRPIFWSNRAKSYISRTDSWDEFPNGRWGDSRSPAFGDIRDGYGAHINLEKSQALSLWGSPTSEEDVWELFANYCRGKVKTLPWSDGPTSKETTIISQQLANLNQLGYLTINSQPVVNGRPSNDPVHGWGPRNGYVYQKAYLEFFVSPERLEVLQSRFESDSSLTYYAVNQKGELSTNNTHEGPNAVTWGVFPGKEIVQPTIVEVVSFLAWKDEAFQLGRQWANFYEPSSPSHQLITSIMDTYYLVNLVHNDFMNPDPNYIFKVFNEEPASLN